LSHRLQPETRRDAPSFESRILPRLPALTPAERKVARFFLDERESLLLGSAVDIAALAGASDATVVRTARSLGFAGLAELRAAALEDLTRAAPGPGLRLKRMLDETGANATGALRHVLATHEEGLGALRTPDFELAFEAAVKLLLRAGRRHIFGIGPSGAIAEYAALQFNRIGLVSSAWSVSGIALADRLLGLGEGDAVLMIAYAPIYREVTVVLEHARALKAPVVLISDSLAPSAGERIRLALPVPRGRAGNLALHGTTLVTIEALVAALAARRRDAALESLEDLAALRGAIDKDWLKRGVTRRRPGRKPVGQ